MQPFVERLSLQQKWGLVMSWHSTHHQCNELNSRSEVSGRRGCAELVPSEPTTNQAEEHPARIQVTGVRQRAARDDPGDVEAVQAQEIVQPLLHGVPRGVPDGLVQGHLVQGASCKGGKGHSALQGTARQASHGIPVLWGAPRLENCHLSPLQTLPSETREGRTAEFHHFPTRALPPQLQRDSPGTWLAAAQAQGHPARGAVPEVSLAVAVALFSAVRVTWLWALCCRSCWMSFSDSERPVPSYLETGHREAAARNQSSGEKPRGCSSLTHWWWKPWTPGKGPAGSSPGAEEWQQPHRSPRARPGPASQNQRGGCTAEESLDTVTASSSLPATWERSEFTELEPCKAPCCPWAPQTASQRLSCGKAERWERVYAALTGTGSRILFSTIPHKFICRGEENKGNLITKSSSCTAPFTFLCFCFGRNPRGSFVIYKSFPEREKVFWGSNSQKICLRAQPTRTVTHHTEWTRWKSKQLQHWQKTRARNEKLGRQECQLPGWSACAPWTHSLWPLPCWTLDLRTEQSHSPGVPGK